MAPLHQLSGYPCGRILFHNVLSRNFHENLRGKGWQWLNSNLFFQTVSVLNLISTGIVNPDDISCNSVCHILTDSSAINWVTLESLGSSQYEADWHSFCQTHLDTIRTKAMRSRWRGPMLAWRKDKLENPCLIQFRHLFSCVHVVLSKFEWKVSRKVCTPKFHQGWN